MNKSYEYGKIYSNAFYAVCVEKNVDFKEYLTWNDFLLNLLKNNNLLVFSWFKQLDNEGLKNFLIDDFKKYLPKIWFNFLMILVIDNQISCLLNTLINLNKLFLTHLKIKIGTVYSVLKLKIEQIKALKIALEKKIGNKVILQTKIDPSLIAGIKVEVVDQVFDNSYKKHLKELRKLLHQDT